MRLNAWIAELIGTFAVCFMGVGAILVASQPGSGSGLVEIALAQGLAYAVCVTAFAPVSGGHLNPAVTLGAWVANRIQLLPALGYIVAQCLGAVAALATLRAAVGIVNLENVEFGIPALRTGITAMGGIVLEAVATFFLATAYLLTAVDRRAPKLGGLVVGFAVVMGILATASFTGGCLNPARYLGSAVVAANFIDVVVYLAGPILGGAVAAVLAGSFGQTSAPEPPAS
ncbi:MAG: aquaporin [Fimbriimonadaceae bacterium]